MRLIDQKRKKYAISIGAVVMIIAILIGIKVKKHSTMAAVSNGEKFGASSNRSFGDVEEIAIDSYIGEVLIQDAEEEDVPTEEEIEEGKKNISSESKYYIKINHQANVVTVYQRNDDDEYTPIKAMTCSTGAATPKSGVYSVQGKWTWGALFGNVWGHYVTKIVGNILFHSVPYLSADPGTLEYWEYDKLGTSASAGCVRLSVADAQWIYNNMPAGTPIEFYGSSDPGPLGKPGTRKISDNEACRDWDPTDPDPNNPWRYYAEPEIQEQEVQKPDENKDENSNTPNNQINPNTTINNNESNTNTNTNTSNQGNNGNQTNNNSNNDTTHEEQQSNENQGSSNETNNNESNDSQSNKDNRENDNSQNENKNETEEDNNKQDKNHEN